MLLSIIIVNYNTADHVKMCLESLYRYLQFDNFEIIIADNHSTNRDIKNLVSLFPKVKFIFREINDGFGGCNEAVINSKGKYLLFLNPDIKIFDDTISILLEYIQKNEESGVVSGLLVNADNSIMYSFNRFTNLKWEFWQMIGLGHEREIKQLINREEIKKNKLFEVDWFHGAFLMMSRNDFDSVNGFNEKYFMYYEDTELCYKIKNNLNKKNYCLPSVRVYHHTQSSLTEEKTDDIYTFHMNRGKILFSENLSFMVKFVVKSMGFISVVIRILYLPFQRKYTGWKKVKFNQLINVLKLYMSRSYLESSKFKYVKI
ncbi:MAG: glycosyltransferase family 2 protein [Ignavibacteria bacterium]|nr:glycosyltransferase family 2 protein [Ignavibacteria bacterium]